MEHEIHMECQLYDKHIGIMNHQHPTAHTLFLFLAKAPVLVAEKHFSNLFPNKTQQTDFAIMIRRTAATNSSSNSTASIVDDPRTRRLVDDISSWIVNRTTNDSDVPVLGTASYFALDALLRASSVPPLFRSIGDALKLKFVSNDSSATIVTLSLNADPTHATTIHFADELSAFVQSKSWDGVQLSVSGISAFLTLMQESVERDLALMDGIVMPLALVVLALVLRSVRLLIIPLVALVVSILVSFAIMYIVAQFIDVVFITPSLMMSMLVATSIDYSLFLLSRYREELLDAQRIDQHAAVVAALRTGGHTVLVSGLTLAVCFAGLVLLPLDSMQTLGIGTAVAVVVALTVNLTLVPALLLTAKNFFWRCVKPTPLPCSSRQITWGARADLCRDNERYNAAGSVASAAAADDGELESVSEFFGDADRFAPPPGVDGVYDANRVVREDERAASAFWYKVGRFTVRFPHGLILLLVVIGAVIYPNLYAFGSAMTNSVAIFLPRSSIDVQEYLQMGNLFGYGTVYPYKLAFEPLWEPPSGRNWSLGEPALSDRAFETTHRIVHKLMSRLDGLTPNDVQTVSFIGGQELHFNQSLGVLGLTVGQAMVDCLDPHSITYTLPQCETTRALLGSFVSASFNGWVAVMTPHIDTQSTTGGDWLQKLRVATAELSAEENVTISVLGMSAYTWDAVWAVQDLFPVEVGVTTGVVLVFIAIAFKSVLVPLMSVLTGALTVGTVYGMADLIYEHGILDWMGFPGLSSSPTHALLWMCPLLAFSVIIGIGLDYNVFLLVRVREYRQTGVYTTPQAVALGLYRSANVITAAGVIMAIAFSGLLFSNIPSLNEVSLYLVVAVLFDTFVVRTLVLTSLMGLTRDATWWPARLTPLREAHSISPNAVDTLATSSLRSNVLDVGDVDQIDVDDEQQ
jgi:uncharacterized membrane protein YdfJ with MMPL/SSD domain